MGNSEYKSIVLFFSYKVSLKIWNDLGMITRESKTWEIFGASFRKVMFITYGDNEEVKLRNRYFPGVHLFNNKWYLHPIIYSIFLPILIRKELLNADIYRVNQVSGAFPAIICKLLYGKRLIIRCGFQLSQFLKEQKENYIKRIMALILEAVSYSQADQIIVTSSKDKEYIIKKYMIDKTKIEVIPNGIDTDLFKVSPEIKKIPGRILFVGRLIKQKNLFLLLESLKNIKDVNLLIIGEGHLKEALLLKAKEYKINITFEDRKGNDELPVEYNKAEIFILPSLFEGNPKVILEAMACGTATIGTDVTGIREIIRDKDNGLLSKADAVDLSNRIKLLLSDGNYRDKIGYNASKFIINNFSLKNTITKEIGLLYK